MGCLFVLLDEREYLGHFTQDDVEYLISVAVVFVEEILDEQALGDGFHEDGQAARLYANLLRAAPADNHLERVDPVVVLLLQTTDRKSVV